MTRDDYTAHDALGLAELVRKRGASPAELVAAAIECIERHNPTLTRPCRCRSTGAKTASP